MHSTLKSPLLLICVFLFLFINRVTADLVWTGNGDGVSFFQETNWRDETTGQIPPNGLIDPGRVLNRNIVIDQARSVVGGGSGVSQDIQLGTGNLTLSNSRIRMRTSGGKLIDLGATNRVLKIEDSTIYTSDIKNALVEMKGSSSIFFFGDHPIAEGTTINLQAEESWIYFLGVRPQEVRQLYLPQIRARGEAAVNSENVSVSIYQNGTAVRLKPFYPLSVWDSPNLRGTRLDLSRGYLRGSELEPLQDRIQSFLLKKGYMTTFSVNPDGSGASKVFIAAEADLEIDSLPDNLRNSVSAIRTVPWIYAPKKGVCTVNNPDFRSTLDAAWYYEWEIRGWSNLNEHFVPMMKGSRAYEWDISDTRWNDVRWGGGTSFLYLNEPDSENQGDATVAEAIDYYPQILKLGLRIGSPACTDNAAGRAWLDSFMSEIKRLDYRIDFIAIHYYQTSTAQQLRNRLQSIYDDYGLPIWVTEFNYGGTWSGNATETQVRNGVQAFCETMDELDFVERYSVFSFSPGNNRSLFSSNNPFVLNSTGSWYLNHKPPLNLGRLTPAARANSLVTGDGVLVPPGASWSYLDDGNSPPDDWASLSFSDANWKKGNAPLGYGDDDEATIVDFGNRPQNRHITTYFRHHFTVDSIGEFSDLTLSILADDGALIRLNGTPILRLNLPEGEIGPDTPASETISGPAERTWLPFEVDACLLNPGVNVITAEVHQISPGSSDLGFDLSLIGTHHPNGQLPCKISFRRGDCNSDGTTDISDAIFTLSALFIGEGEPNCNDACDSNDDGSTDISDVVSTLSVLFLGQGIIPLPGSDTCGVDPSEDTLDCADYSNCS